MTDIKDRMIEQLTEQLARARRESRDVNSLRVEVADLKEELEFQQTMNDLLRMHIGLETFTEEDEDTTPEGE